MPGAPVAPDAPVGDGLVGLGLLWARLARWPGADLGVRLYVELFQGTPLLMQLFLAYFGLALLGLNVSAWAAAALALTLYTSAFLTEIWRGCVNAVPRGQWEASQSLALHRGHSPPSRSRDNRHQFYNVRQTISPSRLVSGHAAWASGLPPQSFPIQNAA